MHMSDGTKMDPELWTQYKKNANIFRQRIDDICEKYANVEDPGFDLCLETMTYKTRKGTLPAEGVEAERELNCLQRFADKNVKTLKDVSNTEDTLVTYGNEDEVKEDHGHYDPVPVMEGLPGESLLEASHVSSSLLSLPEEQDPELERTFSSQSDTPTLQELYPSMLSQIHEACQRQQASKAASSLRRKYHRQRWKAKPQSFMNGSTVGRTSANFKTPSVAPSGSTQTQVDTHHARDTGSGQRSSPWKCATSQAAAGNAPVLVMDFSTPPSSGPSSPSDSSPDLDRTYEVRTSPPVPHTSRCSEQQVRKHQQQQQQVNKVKSLYPLVGASHASQPVTGPCDVRPHTQVFPSPKRRNYEGSLSSPSKMNSVLKSPSHHHHHNDMSLLMEYSPPRREEALSSPRRFSYTQLGHPEKQRDEARWTSQMKSISNTQYSVSPQQQTSRVRCSWQTEELSSLGGETMPSPHPYMGGAKCNSSGTVLTGGHSPYKRRFLNGEASQSSFSRSGGVERVQSSSGTMGGYRPYMRRNLSGEVTQSSFSQKEPSRSVLVGDYSPYKQQCLSREAAESSPSKASLGRNSFIHSAYSASGSKLSSHPSHPEVYTSPSHRHHHHQQQHHHQDLQENLKPSPSRLEALQTRRRSFSGPKDAKRSQARRLSSSIQHINQEFRQLYHQHICQRKSRSSLSRHRSSCCLCEQKAEGCSPSSRVSSVSTTTSTSASATNSRLAALSLTPVRRRRFQSDLSPLLKRLQRKRQVPSSLLQSQHHQKSQQQPLYSYSNDCDDTASMTSDASDDDQPPDLYRGAQISSGSRHHNHQHHYYPTGSSSTLAALGLAPPHARLSKRRCLSEPKESPSLKRFRESTQAHLSPSKSHGFPQHQRHQQREGGDDDDDNGDYDGGEEDMIAPVGNGLSEEHLIRSRALLLQCPSPRFLRAAMRLMKAGSGSRTRPSLEARPHASAWRSQQDHVHEAEAGMSEEAWNESGLSPSLSRRRLLYGVPRC